MTLIPSRRPRQRCAAEWLCHVAVESSFHDHAINQRPTYASYAVGLLFSMTLPSKSFPGLLRVAWVDVDGDRLMAQFQRHHCRGARSTKDIHHHALVGAGDQQKAAHKFSGKRRAVGALVVRRCDAPDRTRISTKGIIRNTRVTIAVHPKQTGLRPSCGRSIEPCIQRLANGIEIEHVVGGFGEHQHLFEIAPRPIAHQFLASLWTFIPDTIAHQFLAALWTFIPDDL